MTDQPRPAVCLEGVSRTYGDFRAVDSLALVVNEGEFFSIIGPSGCGKTTTLRMIAGLESMTAGRIFVAGRDISNEPAFRRPVNTVFQNYALFPHLSVYENVAFGLRERGEPRKAIKTTVHAMLELVGLTGRETARPRELSGGQQQRVALARALVLEPAVLLLDEPLGALDLKLRRQMQDVLKDIQRDTKVTFIYVTHDQEEAFSMSERVAVMNGGVLEQVGEPYDVYHRPCSLFVAEFVGASNPVAGTVVGELGVGRYHVRLPSVASPIALQGVLGLRRGDSVYALLRPEAAVLGELSGPGLSATGAVRDVSYFGPQVRYSIAANGVGDLSVVADVDIRTGPLAPGAPLTISWEADGLWIVPSSEQPTHDPVGAEDREQVDD